MLTTQLPDGATVHRVLGKAGTDDPSQVLHEFAGFTTEGQWLVNTPPTPWQSARFPRVQTTASPSRVGWREIQAYAQA